MRTLFEPATGVGGGTGGEDGAVADHRPACAAHPSDAKVIAYEQTHGVLDPSALVLWLPAPRSATGQDVLELHVHGGPATVKAVLAAIPRAGEVGEEARRRSGGRSGRASNDEESSHHRQLHGSCRSVAHPLTLRGGQADHGMVSGESDQHHQQEEGIIRYAEPGEFTRRAFLNGRLDLAQVESLGDQLAAETEQQRRAAVRGSSGALGRIYEGWRAQLLAARAELEALIDFSEDQHFDESPRELMTNVARQVMRLLDAVDEHQDAGRRSELLRSGIRIALVGPSNAGKSSLMNLVVGREASIVSREAGTTRDIVEAGIDLRGYLCTFADTAGFRQQGRHSLARAGEQEARRPESSGVLEKKLRGNEVPNVHLDQVDNVSEYGGGEPSADAAQISMQLPARDDSLAHDPVGSIEAEGIRRARRRALDSDLVIALASVEPSGDRRPGGFRVQYDIESLRLAAQAPCRLVVVNKRDFVGPEHLQLLIKDFLEEVLTAIPGLAPEDVVSISCLEARGRRSAGGNGGDGGGREVLGAESEGVGVAGVAVGVAIGDGRLSSTTDSTTTHQTAVPVAPRSSDPGGVKLLMDRLADCFDGMTALPADLRDLLGVTERMGQLLSQCRAHLEDFLSEAKVGSGNGEDDGDDGNNDDDSILGGRGAISDSRPSHHGAARLRATAPRPPPGAAAETGDARGGVARGGRDRHSDEGHFGDHHRENHLPRRRHVTHDTTRPEIQPDIVVAAEHLRYAAQCLARITGRGEESGDVDEVLGVVFEK